MAERKRLNRSRETGRVSSLNLRYSYLSRKPHLYYESCGAPCPTSTHIPPRREHSRECRACPATLLVQGEYPLPVSVLRGASGTFLASQNAAGPG